MKIRLLFNLCSFFVLLELLVHFFDQDSLHGWLPFLIMSLKNMLKKYKAVPRNEPPPPPAPEPVNKKLCYLQELHESYVSKHKEYVSSTSSTMSTAPVPPQSSRGLGLLFIIIDDLPHEYIWRTFIRMHEEQQRRSNSCDINPIRVWIHAKYPQHVNRYESL